mmetsp:Transcript_129124/g.413825  ORF Transcript_129124/g.413825 Transcript_129124/m.413825 type:complete len:228 (-) Transcript_129124:623-1306(-)
MRTVLGFVRRHQLVLHEEGGACQDGCSTFAAVARRHHRCHVPRGQSLLGRRGPPVDPTHQIVQLDRGRERARQGGKVLPGGPGELRRELHERHLPVRGRPLQQGDRGTKEVLHATSVPAQPGPQARASKRRPHEPGLLVQVFQECIQRCDHPVAALFAGVPAGVPAHPQVSVYERAHVVGQWLPGCDGCRSHEHRHHRHHLHPPLDHEQQCAHEPSEPQLHRGAHVH